ncbi:MULTISPECIES: PAS domain-containing protein [unclassified Duganella]|uniref:PAS domain-containing protein n=1 Tax=unclassified Duganella TaxID=2636909 RepID=UPI001E4A8B5A|nr:MULTISPECIES: PAS domain-containing protein [unclassified Duganella]
MPSIRSQIALLVLACALPTVVGFGALVGQFYSREHATLKNNTQQAARAMAAAIDRDLVQSEGAAQALASSPSLRERDWAALRLQAGALLSPQFPASQFVLSDGSGKALLNLGAPLPDTLNPVNNRRRLAALFGHGRPQMSVVMVEGSALLAIDVPVFVDSRIEYALTALLKPDRLTRILKEEHISADQAMTLYDADGNVVAQSGGPRLLLGHAADPALREHLHRAQEVLLETSNAEGTPVYLGLSRAPVSGATVGIATPQARAMQDLLASVSLIALTMLAVLAAGFSLAWIVGGRIARSVRELVAPAQALVSGKPFAMPDTTFSEADMVARALRALEGDLLRHSQELEQLVAERTRQLERNRAQLETVYATAPVGLSYVDSELRIVRINDYLAALNDEKVVAHLGRHIGDLIRDHELRRAVLADYRTVLDSGKPLTGIRRSGSVASAPGQLREWVMSYYPQFSGDGKIIGITSMVLDETEYKRVETELQRSRQLLSSVVEHIPAMIFLKRAEDLSYAMFNRFGAQMLGSTSEQLIGKNDYDFVPAEQADLFAADDRRVLATVPGEVTEIAEEPLSTATGTRYLTTRKVALRNEHGVATHVLAIALDITERKEAKEVLRATAEQLAASEHFVRTVTDNLPGMVAYWDAGLRCRFANRYFLDWHGLDSEKIIGAYMPEVVGDSLYAEGAPYVQAALAGEPQGFAGKLQWPSGEISHTWVNYIPDIDESGTVQGFFVLVSDVTELKETELHLQEVNEELIVARDRAEAASRAKSEFLANMSHEIRTPMNAIIGLTRLLEEAPLAPRERGYLHKIQFATQSLLSLVNDVLDFSRVEAGQLVLEHAHFHLQHILDSISVMLSGSAADKGVELVYDIDPALPTELAGDPMRLQQVLLNLISNAIKFTAHGEVVLSVRLAPGSAKPGDHALLIEFRVRDTGIGIAPEQLTHIFEAFSQADSSTSRKFGGAGLGLAICRQLADMMGGAISVTSEPGRGSEFLFACPLESPQALHAAEPPPATTTLSVLIVDDNASVRQALLAAGRSFGWHTACAVGAEQARTLLIERARADRPYDLLLLDHDMPGTDGPALLRQLPPELALPPILMLMSEHQAATLSQQSAELGLAGVLAKPVSPARLLERVSGLLAGDLATTGILAQLEHTPLQGRLAGMRILLVEDNEINQEVAEYMLLHAGASVEVAANGKLAVELLAAAPERYDVVLMDVQMPVMNGYDATREIRRQGLLTLPIIAMTANVLEDDRRRAAESGMNAHVAKPIDVEELISVLTRLVTIRDATREMVAPVPAKAPPQIPAAALMPPISPLPGIDTEAALARLGGNYEALSALLKRFEQSQGGAVNEVRALLGAHQRQQAEQVLHRLRGVAANLGATDVARLSAAAEAILQDASADSLAMPAALNRLEQALGLVTRTARNLATPTQNIPTSNTEPSDLAQKLAELQSLLQNNNLKALEHFRALRPSLASAEQAQALSEAVETLNFKAARQMVEEMLQRKESA